MGRLELATGRTALGGPMLASDGWIAGARPASARRPRWDRCGSSTELRTVEGERCSSGWDGGSSPRQSQLARVGCRFWAQAVRTVRRDHEPVPFLAQTEGIEPLWPVNRQHAVEVIDLVLQ